MTVLIDGPDQVLYQWDRGQRVMLRGVPDGVRVDFALRGSDKAVSMDVYTDSGIVFCDIPDSLLMRSGQLHGYIYEGDTEHGETIFSFSYQLIPRPKPEDYVEPEEVLLWHELDRRISELEKNGVSAEQIGAAVEKYLEENPVEVPEPDLTGVVKSVNGKTPDQNGNVEITIPDSPQDGDLTGYAKEQWVKDNYQPKGKYLTEVPEGYAKTEDIPTEPEDIGADPKGTAASAVGEHNVDTDAHNDIRLTLKKLSDRLTAFFDSDDSTLDELSEIVAYITSNKSLIDSITTSKINVSDVINNLTTNVSNKPLSAAQGVVLNGLINTLNTNLNKYALVSAIPTKVSQLQNDAGYLNEHQDISGKLDASELPTAINTALAQAKSSGEFDGAPGKDGADGQPGKDGTSPVVSVSAIKGGHRITITDKNGTKTVDVLDGSDGKDGKDGNPGTNGQDGNGIKSAVLNADYTLTLTFDDGTSYTTPSIRGATGPTGATGSDGKDGTNGKDGKNAYEYAQDGGYTGTEEDFAEKLAKNYSVVSVTDYGANGDGSTDDTDAFQTALVENRVVFVPGGTYVLSDTLLIRENCELELSQDTVLKFTQTDKNGINMQRSASIRGNHATIFVPYTFGANVLHLSTDVEDGNANDTPPWTAWDPQWKMSRYVTDINICKPNSWGGRCNSLDGAVYGTAVDIYCERDTKTTYPQEQAFMWGVNLSGVRIAGGFVYGMHIHNKGTAWNHDMRIETVIQGCETAVCIDNCHKVHLTAAIQPLRAEQLVDGSTVSTPYAKNGIKLVNSEDIDLSQSFVWDWQVARTDSEEYTHIAMYGDCHGLILNEPRYHDAATDVRKIIYTDTPANLEKMVILQEPITRWFKVEDGLPYFSTDGLVKKRLTTEDELAAYFDTDIVKSFTDVLATATETDGTLCGDKGYRMDVRLQNNGTYKNSDEYYGCTGIIPCKKGDTIVCEGIDLIAGPSSSDGISRIILFKADHTIVITRNQQYLTPTDYFANYTETDNGFKLKICEVSNNNDVAYVRFNFSKMGLGENPMIAVNEEIGYTVEGFLADGVKVKGENIIGNLPGGGVVTDEQIADAVEDYLQDHPIEVPDGGSASIDVTATVGQTIVVEEVDANGKPTKWKAADYQPRTHWTEEIVQLPETTVEIDPEEGYGVFPVYFTLEVGKAYMVKYNGVEYPDCECMEVEGAPALGNAGALIEGMPVTEHPFMLVYGPLDEDENGNPIFAWAMAALDGSTSVTLSITENKHTPVPVEYVSNAFPYYIEVSGDGTTENPYVCHDTVANVEAALRSGREIKVKRFPTGEASYVLYTMGAFISYENEKVYFFYVVDMAPTATQETVRLFLKVKENGTFGVDDKISDF